MNAPYKCCACCEHFPDDVSDDHDQPCPNGCND